MNRNEFETFHAALNVFIAEKFSGNLKVSSCEILEQTNLLANEKQIINKSVPKRVREFSAGRVCARKCLSAYGLGNVEILKGKFGEPIWPEGYTGSITHHDNVAVAVAMRATVFPRIGIDLVSLKDVLDGTDLIASDRELKMIKNVSFDVDPGILVFSIKESIIKICSPLFQEFIDFRDISLSYDEQGYMRASMNRLSRLVKVQWIVVGNSIFSIATLDGVVGRKNNKRSESL